MTLAQFVLGIVTVIFIVFSIDLFQRRKFNFLHFLVFFIGGGVTLYFIFNVQVLDQFGKFFGVARGADLIIYTALILFGYFYFELLNKITKSQLVISRLVSQLAIKSVFNPLLPTVVRNEFPGDEFIFAIRAYNEQKNIGSVIDEIYTAGYSKIVIVSDGSKDRTRDVVREKQLHYKDRTLIFLEHPINRGGGAANKTLFTYLTDFGDELKVKRVVTYDADGQMDINDMKKFIKGIQQHPEVTIFLGSRFIKGASFENMPMMRRVILWGAKIVTLAFNRLWLSDPHNGYRVIHLDAIKKIHIDSDNMTYANDLVDEIRRNKLIYKEIPVHIVYTDYSLQKGQSNGNSRKILKELIYKKFFYK